MSSLRSLEPHNTKRHTLLGSQEALRLLQTRQLQELMPLARQTPPQVNNYADVLASQSEIMRGHGIQSGS